MSQLKDGHNCKAPCCKMRMSPLPMGITELEENLLLQHLLRFSELY